MGYTGGRALAPTYGALGDHTEAVQLDFDPARISYEALLEVFWGSHLPALEPAVTQYKAAVFVHDEHQRRLAEASRDRLQEALGEPVRSEILPAGTFFRAEAYHQKFYLRRHREIAIELLALYPDDHAFTDSTAAARLNGLLGGHESVPDPGRFISRLGLPDAAKKAIITALRDL